MANIKLTGLLKEAEDFQAKSKQTGKLVHFKSKDSYQAAIKAGTHEDPKAQKGAQPKSDVKPNSMFGADYAKDRGGEAPKVDADVYVIDTNTGRSKKFKNTVQAQKFIDKNGGELADFDTDGRLKALSAMNKGGGNTSAAKSKYDEPSYWKLSKDDYRDSEFTDDDDDSWSDDSQFTADSLDLVNNAINDEFRNEVEITREFGGGQGGWEGPMQIFSKGADLENSISISVGSSNQDGTFSILFLEPGGEEALFEPNWDGLSGDQTLKPQQAYKVTKALLKMPEVQKLLKGEMKPKEFGPTYAKLKDKFSKGKTESTKLTSMIKK